MLDLLQTITEKEAQIATLEEDVAALKRAAKILGWNTNGSKPKEPAEVQQKEQPKEKKQKSGPGTYVIPVGDAAEQVLREASGPLHVKAIHKQILARWDMEPTWISVDSAMRKDRKGRFELKGKRLYDLKQRVLPLSKALPLPEDKTLAKVS